MILWYEWIKIIKLMSSFDGSSSKMSKFSGLIQYFWSPSLDGFSVFAPGSRTNFLSFLCGCPVFQPRQDGRLRAMSIQIKPRMNTLNSKSQPPGLFVLLYCSMRVCIYIYNIIIYIYTFCLEDLRNYSWKTDFCRSFSQQTFWSTWG